MRIIVPMAGMGKRMRPHTLTTPKPLLPVAGKPIVQRLVEDIAAVCGQPVEEVAYIIGRFGEATEQKLKDIAASLGARASIHYQDDPLGTAHAILCAKEALEGPVVVAFADTLFRADFVLDASADGVVWTKEVDDPRQFGVVKKDADGFITDFVEKPQHFVSKEAIIGIYFFRDGAYLRSELQYLLDNDIREKGEYQLTNALENMKNKGSRFLTGTVTEWMDCGNKDVTVETNGKVLHFVEHEEQLIAPDAVQENATVIPPCYVGPGAVLKNCTIGPRVSVGAATRVVDSRLEDCIIGDRSVLENVTLRNSMVGNDVHFNGNFSQVSLGDFNRLDA